MRTIRPQSKEGAATLWGSADEDVATDKRLSTHGRGLQDEERGRDTARMGDPTEARKCMSQAPCRESTTASSGFSAVHTERQGTPCWGVVSCWWTGGHWIIRLFCFLGRWCLPQGTAPTCRFPALSCKAAALPPATPEFATVFLAWPPCEPTQQGTRGTPLSPAQRGECSRSPTIRCTEIQTT